jgi:HSP20 family protein
MLMRTDPFRELDRFASQVMGGAGRQTAMPIDAYRHGDVFVVELDIPGVDPASIDLTVEKNVLTVKAERQRSSADGELLIGERSFGSYSRQLFLGDTLDADHLTADCHNGVLTIRVPVAERAKPRRVEIGVGAPGPAPAIETTSTEGADAEPATVS